MGLFCFRASVCLASQGGQGERGGQAELVVRRGADGGGFAFLLGELDADLGAVKALSGVRRVVDQATGPGWICRFRGVWNTWAWVVRAWRLEVSPWQDPWKLDWPGCSWRHPMAWGVWESRLAMMRVGLGWSGVLGWEAEQPARKSRGRKEGGARRGESKSFSSSWF